MLKQGTYCNSVVIEAVFHQSGFYKFYEGETIRYGGDNTRFSWKTQVQIQALTFLSFVVV